MHNEEEKNDFLFKNEDGFLDTDSSSIKEKEVKEKNTFSKINKKFSDDKKNVKLLLIVGVLAIFLGLWGLIFNIKNAFVLSPIVLEDKSGVIEGLNQLKDTDSDGISDYDEKYVYGTSPYLIDTDSDGISDYDEIIAGKSPLCEGDSCEQDLTDTNDDSGTEFKEPQALMTLEELKMALMEEGYSEEQVNQLSEEDLNLIYSEAQKAINNENYNLDLSKISTDNYTLSEEDIKQLENLSISQIKELLIQGGATSEQLDSVAEEDLRKMYLEALQSL